MLNNEWKRLKSGTDIRGSASEGVPEEPIELTDGVIAAVTRGFILWAAQKCGRPAGSLRISVGRDSRISGPRIFKCVSETLVRHGINVLDCGLASTPSMFMTTIDLNCDAAIQITASHHPFHRNGLKFFTRDGGLEGRDIEQILLKAQNGEEPALSDNGRIEKTDYMSTYCSHLRDLIKQGVNADDHEHPLSGFHIVVDAGNGVGGFYAGKVLEPLGADISGSQFLEPDGMFPNHIPNPENADAMRSVSKAVLDNNADLGIIFDTDVDRGGAVDRYGNEINRNRLVAVAAAIALENCPEGTVVTDSITSDGLKEYIEKELGGKHYRYRRGYKNVINKALELNAQGINCPLAIETSGHAAMRENYFLDDGAYLCTKIIIKAACLRREGKDLDSLISTLKEPLESREIRIKITDPDFKARGENIINDLEKYSAGMGWKIAYDNREGIRVSFGAEEGDGWFLLRLSVHDPIMPLNIESNVRGGAETIYAKLEKFLKTAEGIRL